MRSSHRTNGLHRIEHWNGQFFRPAQLWEVGSYILVPHCTGERMCPTLALHDTYLESLQLQKDEADTNMVVPEENSDDRYHTSNQPPETPDVLARQKSFHNQPHITPDRTDISFSEEPNHDVNDEVNTNITEVGLPDNLMSGNLHQQEQDVSYLKRLNRMYGLGLGRSVDRDGITVEADDDEGTAADSDIHMPASTDLPRRDAMNNAYVRIIHTNGIHFIALVTCDCHGAAERDTNLMNARLVPTSFVWYRTLFTTAVLDDFRITNLECKASAYQYWQKLSRMTSAATSPSDIDNFYRELRRLSRCWRWIKKLKWAGFGHKEANIMTPAPGELAIFCPTCPQPGVNLPSNWREDENK